ncbi:hypothetical protein RDV89_02480 [Nocardioides zeae]|uniref:Excreted virulence factor EspC (Type VII ESX diderm) n=1 Tax=Nocardioides imazamoxiresistens TaxID=3231893 RepID=A0ABU3PRR5_9ACTN|nr:hypothetical protein [Nocardioides zeae]MDT9591917.1 hypothetical protein [Nocardioides zeae]
MTVLEYPVAAITSAGDAAATAGEQVGRSGAPEVVALVAGAVVQGQTPGMVDAVVARWQATRDLLAQGLTSYGAATRQAGLALAATDAAEAQEYARREPPAGAAAVPEAY